MTSRYAHRMGTKNLVVQRADGTPLAHKEITIAQKKHKFLFGCGMFDAVPLAADPLPEAERQLLADRIDTILALCNFGTLPFYWGRFEPQQGKPDTRRVMAGAHLLQERGVLVKGHPLCWHTVCAPWLMEMSDAEILRTQLARIHRDVGDFRGVINMWDVINEVVIMPIFDKYDNGVTRICKMLGRVSLIREVFAATREANPGAVLLLNDFNTSIDFEILIDGCLQAGVPIDAIGIQSHQHQGYWGLEKLHTVLDRFSAFGLPIHFTENTLISGDLMPPEIEDLNDWQVDCWPSTPEGEARQAREAVEMHETLFAHPLVEAITTWDAVDGKWLHAPSGLLRADNSRKPAYDALLQRVKGDWWTGETALRTDAHAEVRIEGYLGEYELRCGEESVPFTLDAQEGERRVEIVV